MEYSEFYKWLEGIRPVVLTAVEETEKSLRAGVPPTSLQPQPQLPFTGATWRAYCQNTAKLIGVKRITGAPYATHPTRMAWAVLMLLADDEEREHSAIFTLFHDYLEEGDGRNREAVERFIQEFPAAPDAVLSSIILSEPEIDYDAFPVRRKMMEHVAYVRQIQRAMVHLADASFYNAALADKLDNIHDLDYILCNPRYSPEKVRSRLLEKFGYFQFVNVQVGHRANPALQKLLASAIDTISAQHEFTREEVRHNREHLEELLREHGPRLDPMIDDYHRDLRISWER